MVDVHGLCTISCIINELLNCSHTSNYPETAYSSVEIIQACNAICCNEWTISGVFERPTAKRYCYETMDVKARGTQGAGTPPLFQTFDIKCPFSTYILHVLLVRVHLNACVPHFLSGSYVLIWDCYCVYVVTIICFSLSIYTSNISTRGVIQRTLDSSRHPH